MGFRGKVDIAHMLSFSNAMTTCPDCGREMEKGYLGVASLQFSRPSWFKEKSTLGVGGDPLIDPRMSLAYFEGMRCVHCRTLHLSY